MFRILTALFLLSFPVLRSSGQQIPVLKYGRLNPRNSLESLRMDHPKWKSARYGRDYFVLVQTDGNLNEALKRTLAGSGVRVGESLSGGFYLAVIHAGFDRNSHREIKRVFGLPPSLKYDLTMIRQAAEKQDRRNLFTVSCFDVNKRMVEQALRENGAAIVETHIKPPHVWFVRADTSVAGRLAKLPFVFSISAIHLEDVPLNYNNRAIHSVQALSNPFGRNLLGRNMIVGIGDNANPSSHIDLSGKLIMRTDEPVDDHGTHTSGIISGGGVINPMYTGMAPRAHLVVNDFSNIIVNSPAYVFDYNIPLTNNSYYNGLAGCTGEGEYNVLSYYVDSQLLAYPRLLHVFASGNDGAFTCTPYPAAFGTIKSGFQTSKNVLTVGSMNNTNYDIGGGSSRGPTTDGRLKPELVAGGVLITSTISNNNYAAFIGTSMASPTVTGILALVAERYRQMHGGANPEGALLKTLAINGAVDLGNPGPDFTFGFGMINGRRTVEALEQNRYVSGTVNDGATQTLSIPSVPAGGYQLKITLYWPDVPALPLASKSLVNDLDLVVTDPGGAVHFPLILDPSPANVQNNAVEGPDHKNNVEQVIVTNPPVGNYTLSIKGFSVPQGPQPFFLAWELIRPSVTLEYPFGGETWVPGQTEFIRWSAYGGDTNPFTLEYSPDGGASWNLISNNIPATARSFGWNVPALFSHNVLMRLTRNVSGFTDISGYPFTILQQPVLTVTSTCPGYARLNWNAIPGADQYEILKLSGDSMQVIGSTTSASWLANGLNKDSSYWFSVRAVMAGFAGRRSAGQQVIPNAGPCTDAGLDNDLTLDTLIAPVTGRQFTSGAPGNQRVSIHVRNAGNVATSTPLQFSYQVNGGSIVTESSGISIPAHAGMQYDFSLANAYDFSAPGSYYVRAWVSYSADTVPSNDTLTQTVKNLRNDPLTLNPSFTEGFESAVNRAYTLGQTGLDSLDRADFFNSNPNGRLNTYFNQGFPRTGQRAMVLDVTEQGTFAADSLINTFNLSAYGPSDQIWLDLYFRKQSPITPMPGNFIWIRGNDQAAWIPVKTLSDPLDQPGIYEKLNIDISGTLTAAGQAISSSFQVKCGSEGKLPAGSMDPDALPGGGISFDDFTLTNSLNDLAMLGLLQPSFSNLCALGNAEKISVLVKNYGTDTLKNIPVSYAVNQDTVTEIIPSIAPKDSLQFNFTQTANLSAFQKYSIKTWVSYSGDNYRNNDSSRNLVIQTSPLISQYPYLEGFEGNNGYWFTGGQNSSWAWGHPSKTYIHKAANGSNAWVTSLTGNYNDNEYSFLYSPCFDLSSLTRPVLSFSHIFRTEDDCNCDYHWVEYSTDDVVWTRLGAAGQGTHWYEDVGTNTWQQSYPLWHVSSIDLPVNPPKIRFRFVMYSDPGTNYEGVGIDDIHVFEKAPVYAGSLADSLLLPVSGNSWTDFNLGGKRLLSIHPQGQDLGPVNMKFYRDTLKIRDTAGQYYAGRSWVVQTGALPDSGVRVRYYFTDSEALRLIAATGCASCESPDDPYSLGITQYSSPKLTEEDSTLQNNINGVYLFHKPQQDVQVIPYDNGYYAETTIKSFSEFWLNTGGQTQDQPLAAWLKSFTAVKSGNSGLLKWTSWAEVNTTKYIIERSADSLHFHSIGQKPAIPHTDSTQDYQFTDPLLAEGDNFYRLVLYFQTGDSLLSPVRKIREDGPPAEYLVFPNPTTGNIQVNSPSPCKEIQIFDLQGRKLADYACSGYVQNLSVAGFSRGVYFLKLFTDNGNKVIKLEKR